MTNVARKYYQQHDRKRKSDREYATTKERRKRRAEKKLEMIRSVWKSEVEDKRDGHTYQSRMAAPKVTTRHGGRKKKDGDGSSPFCRACGNYGHSCRTSKMCPKNPRNNLQVDEGTNESWLCILILQACASVLINRSISTYRESNRVQRAFCEPKRELRTLHGFRNVTEREDGEARRYGVSSGQ